MDAISTAVSAAGYAYTIYEYLNSVYKAGGERSKARTELKATIELLKHAERIINEVKAGSREPTGLELLIRKRTEEEILAEITRKTKKRTEDEILAESTKKTAVHRFSSFRSNLHLHKQKEKDKIPKDHNVSTDELSERSTTPSGISVEVDSWVAGDFLQLLYTELKDLGEDLKLNKLKTDSGIDKLRWYWASKDVDKSLETITKHSQKIEDALNHVWYVEDEDQHKRVIDTQQTAQLLRGDVDMRNMVDWLGLHPFHGRDPTGQSAKFEDSGLLFDSEEYRAWLKQPPWWLWCYGNKGVGKTYLCSQVIKDLRGRLPVNSLILGLFIDSDHPPTQVVELISSLVLILVQLTSGKWPAKLDELLAEGRRLNQPPPLSGLMQVLQEAFAVPKRVCIVVDGWHDISQKILVEFSSKLHELFNGGRNVSILVASRTSERASAETFLNCNVCGKMDLQIYYKCSACNYDVCERCYDDNSVSCGKAGHEMAMPNQVDKLIQPDSIATANYVKWRMEQLIGTDDQEHDERLGSLDLRHTTLQEALLQQPTLKDQLPQAISKISRDNFGRAEMYCEQILYQDSYGIIQTCAGNNIPKDLAKEYDHILDSLQSTKSEGSSAQIIDALYWLARAKERLHFSALGHAIHMDLRDPQWFPEQAMSKARLVANSKGLIRTNPQDEMYIEAGMDGWILGEGSRYFQGKDADVALKLLACLNSQKADETVGLQIEGVLARLEKSPLLWYANRYWPDHVIPVLGQEAVYSSLLEFLSSPTSIASWAQVNYFEGGAVDCKIDVRSGINGVHLAAYFGLDSIIRDLIDQGADVNNKDPRYQQCALTYACRQGHLSTVQLLLSKGVSPNTWTSRRGHPIFEAYTAADIRQYHRRKIAGLLLDHSEDIVNLHNPRRDGVTLLILAAANGDEVMLRQLLERDRINIYAKDNAGRDALLHAIETNNFNILDRLLSDRRMAGYTSTQAYATALSRAATLSDSRFVKRLLDAPKHWYSKFGHCYQQALFNAVKYGRLVTMELFLNRGIRIDVINEDQRTLLHQATYQINSDLTQRLIQAGLNINARDKSDSTPLHQASRLGNLVAAEALLAAGADDKLRDSTGRTPLVVARQNAVTPGHNQIMAKLDPCDDGSNEPREQTESYITELPIWSLVRLQLVEEIQCRIASPQGTILTEPDPDTGNTALHYAVLAKNAKVTEILLKAGAAQSFQNFSGQTPFYIAAQKGHYNVFRALFESSPVALEIQANDKSTPLTIAQRNKHLTIAVELIAAGAQIHLTDRTALQRTFAWAIYVHDAVAVARLLKAGADPMGTGLKGKPEFEGLRPLQIAQVVAKGDHHDEIVKMLMDPEPVYDGIGAVEGREKTNDDEIVRTWGGAGPGCAWDWHVLAFG